MANYEARLARLEQQDDVHFVVSVRRDDETDEAARARYLARTRAGPRASGAGWVIVVSEVDAEA